MAYELIETIEVGAGGASSIEFTSIPQDGVDLLLVASLRGDGGANAAKLAFNGVTTNLSYIFLQGTGSTAASGSNATYVAPFAQNRSTTTASVFANSQAYVSNYTASSAKSISGDGVEENNDTTAYGRISAGLWNDTDPITSIQVISFNNFVQYSTASLYKIS